jgi:hypothetical protein
MAVAPSLSLRPAGPTRAPQPGDPATEIVPGCRPGGLDRGRHHDGVPSITIQPGLRRSVVMSVSSESDPEGGKGSVWVAGVAA